jgi:hypothetical protein
MKKNTLKIVFIPHYKDTGQNHIIKLQKFEAKCVHFGTLLKHWSYIYIEIKGRRTVGEFL